MPKPHVTAIIDRLIDAGYVERQSDPKDRRIINISLTPKGSKIFETTQKLVSKNLKSKLLLLSDVYLEKLSVA